MTHMCKPAVKWWSLVLRFDITHLCVTWCLFVYRYLDKFVCAMTNSYVPWRIPKCHDSYIYTCRKMMIAGAQMCHYFLVCDMTHSAMTHAYLPWLIHIWHAAKHWSQNTNHTRTIFVFHLNEACHNDMSHVTHMNASCHTYWWVKFHIWMGHGMYESGTRTHAHAHSHTHTHTHTHTQRSWR